MKLPLATGILSAAILAGCGGASAEHRYVMRVDRMLDRRGSPSMLPSQDVPADRYRAMPPADRWEITIQGASVVITAIGTPETGVARLEGREVSSGGGERRFDLDKGNMAGGRFVMRGDEAELTMFGSGVPIISSERGKLVAR